MKTSEPVGRSVRARCGGLSSAHLILLFLFISFKKEEYVDDDRALIMLKDKDKCFDPSGSYVLSTAFGVVIISIDIGFTASFSCISHIYSRYLSTWLCANGNMITLASYHA